jgi:hypothetical protein
MTKAQVLTLHKVTSGVTTLESWRRAGAQIADAALEGYRNENGEIEDISTVNAEHREST